MSDVDGLVAALGLLAFMAILIAWDFITGIFVSFGNDLGTPVGIPKELNALVFIIAVAVAILIYLSFSSTR